MKISVLQHVVTADKSCMKERMLRAGPEPPRVDWSPPRAPSAPTAMRVFAVSSQQALKSSDKHPFLPSGAGWVPAGTARGGGAGRGGQSSSGDIPGAVPMQGHGGPGQRWRVRVTVPAGVAPCRGRCQRSCGGAVPRGRAAAVPASPHLSGIRCSIAGNSQRIPALNCSRLSSFSQGLSRCVGDAG